MSKKGSLAATFTIQDIFNAEEASTIIAKGVSTKKR
jgi:hypothetical protein